MKSMSGFNGPVFITQFYIYLSFCRSEEQLPTFDLSLGCSPESSECDGNLSVRISFLVFCLF